MQALCLEFCCAKKLTVVHICDMSSSGRGVQTKNIVEMGPLYEKIQIY